jgi:hypothetical protein
VPIRLWTRSPKHWRTKKSRRDASRVTTAVHPKGCQAAWHRAECPLTS